MSYILDTLKKLDKEKSEFENKLNLKELIVKDDSEVHAVRSLKRRNYLLTLLAFAFALFFIQNFSRFNYLNIALNPPPVIKTLKEGDLSKQTPINPVKNSEESFILSPNLSNEAQEPLDLKLTPDDKISTLNSIDTQSVESAESISVSNDLSTDKASQHSDSTEQLIQKKYIPAALDASEEREIKNEKLTNHLPTKVILQRALPQDIRDLKINGIIFFGQDNPLNYALATYRGKDPIKLKAGDRLNEVEILVIQPEKILLIFQDKIYEKGMGR